MAKGGSYAAHNLDILQRHTVLVRHVEFISQGFYLSTLSPAFLSILLLLLLLQDVYDT